MRIVRHPNIVELKAFYYSNGERVCIIKPVNDTTITASPPAQIRR
jgi:hypothetical protein